MDDTWWFSLTALATSIVMIFVAVLLSLIRKTGRVPKDQRLWVMAAIAWRSGVRWLPSRQSVAVATVGWVAFIATVLYFATACWGLLSWYASTMPEETNVLEGAASAMLLMTYASIGIALSVILGMMCGMFVAVRVGSRLSRQK